MSNDPMITDWISAVGTAALGLLGFFITIWQWTATGFRPKPSARIEANRDAIELKVVNNGRATGIVDQLAVLTHLNGALVQVEAHFNGFPNQEFHPLIFPGLASMRIIIESPPGSHFPADAQLKIGLGRRKDQYVIPIVEPAVGIFGLKTVLPPGSLPS
jgi:hypothetical protein